ncbi:GNAT family N-acetyltransferase [Neiella marina]|uniref:GNAT family N-acetyltransferase n=1 Tax=Neiella holothuriorum TaxID=2870530 RepID=A0ABS7EC52_9GAMM|nr:GNAT family N-acetyltransferase [Neiella holothuriorum]MBW8189825.1 GNAT family N-acetyltransferase [Neiella holothuriorum]
MTNELASERLRLIPLDESHLNVFQQLYGNDKVMRNIAPPLDEEGCDKLFNKTLQACQSGKIITWVIIEKSSQNSIGIIGLYQICAAKKQAHIGLMLLPSANGRLYPEEVMAAVMDYGFGKLSLKAIDAEFKISNLATKRFLKKLGFVEQEAAQKEKGESSMQCYQMNESKW